MAEKDPFDLEAIQGLKTSVQCCYCDEQFPFRQTRLFILGTGEEVEYAFVCEDCHHREIAVPFAERVREKISEAEVLEIGEQAFREAIRTAGDDPDAQREATEAWVRFQLMKRRETPPGDPGIN